MLKTQPCFLLVIVSTISEIMVMLFSSTCAFFQWTVSYATLTLIFSERLLIFIMELAGIPDLCCCFSHGSCQCHSQHWQHWDWATDDVGIVTLTLRQQAKQLPSKLVDWVTHSFTEWITDDVVHKLCDYSERYCSPHHSKQFSVTPFREGLKMWCGWLDKMWLF